MFWLVVAQWQRLSRLKRPQQVSRKPFLSGHKDVFAWKLPAVGHVTLLANVRFVAVKQRHFARPGQGFKLAQAFDAMGIAERVRLAGGALSDSFISATNYIGHQGF